MALTNKIKNHSSLIINSLIEMIKNPTKQIKDNAYFYHQKERNTFIIYLYLFKLLINNEEYLEKRYNIIKEKNREIPPNITNIPYTNELDLLLKIKNILRVNRINYNSETSKIYFNDTDYINSKWFITFMTSLLDKTKNNEKKEINICYTIPNNDLSKVTDAKNKNDFLSQFTYYSIKIKNINIPDNENTILVIKNATINYLKHLKQYKYGFEDSNSYLIFYNLLKSECQKENLTLEEQELNLLSVDESILNKLDTLIDDEFYTSSLSKQVQLIENFIWKSSNDITLLEHTNNLIDNLLDLLTLLRTNKDETYNTIKKSHNINDIEILLILITMKFILMYLDNLDEIDYSILNLSSIKPKYMNSICRTIEQNIKNKLKSLTIELNAAKKELEIHKTKRASLDKEKLGEDKYKKELEICVSNINRISIVIARLNSTIASLTREYEDLKKEQTKKYRNVDLYNHNHSIIKHICNSIVGCNYYLKTTNTSSLLSNIIIFEDYERTDNSFYLEVSLKELLKISSEYLLNGIIDQNDLPKLA